MYLKRIALIASIMLMAPLVAHAEQNNPKDVAAIQDVVEKFRTSIIERDKTTFVTLFFSEKPEQVVWQFSNDDARIARFRKTKPEARKARHLPEVNYLTFIDSIVASKNPSEEVFKDIRIDTDGEIGAVAFDYEFLSDGKQTNWGREMWQLVRTEEGWKIISVIWTIHDPVESR